MYWLTKPWASSLNYYKNIFLDNSVSQQISGKNSNVNADTKLQISQLVYKHAQYLWCDKVGRNLDEGLI